MTLLKLSFPKVGTSEESRLDVVKLSSTTSGNCSGWGILDALLLGFWL